MKFPNFISTEIAIAPVGDKNMKFYYTDAENGNCSCKTYMTNIDSSSNADAASTCTFKEKGKTIYVYSILINNITKMNNKPVLSLVYYALMFCMQFKHFPSSFFKLVL